MYTDSLERVDIPDLDTLNSMINLLYSDYSDDVYFLVLASTILSLCKWEQNYRQNDFLSRRYGPNFFLGHGSDSCPLCILFLSRDGYCDNCPIFRVDGRTCLYKCEGKDRTPYNIAVVDDNTEPLISVLKEAVELVYADVDEGWEDYWKELKSAWRDLIGGNTNEG